ncbi:MAG TPA: zf-HC2 domain-containing protein [Candidatus Eisenbacteria bacterium]|nr:zf-HC2 domain-containing protein [Candidatus Eisenbacteria bacterium]
MATGARQDDTHRWALARFTARRAGLLDDDEERRMAEHLATCDSCRRQWEEDAAVVEGDGSPAPGPDAHIPAGVLAAWPRAAKELRGIERTMVREHLARCSECRQELELLGHAPELAVVPALEWMGQAREVPAAPPTESPHKIIVLKPEARRRDWTRWAFGSWAALASAAALLLVMNPGLIGPGRQGEGPVVTPSPTQTPTPVLPAPAPPGLTVVDRPLRLQAALRGEAAKLPERTISPGTRLLAIVVEPLDLPDRFPVQVTIRREEGGTPLEATVANADLASGRLVLSAGGLPLEPGTYVVQARGGPAPDAILPEPQTAEYRFVLKAAGTEGGR